MRGWLAANPSAAAAPSAARATAPTATTGAPAGAPAAVGATAARQLPATGSGALVPLLGVGLLAVPVLRRLGHGRA